MLSPAGPSSTYCQLSSWETTVITGPSSPARNARRLPSATECTVFAPAAFIIATAEPWSFFDTAGVGASISQAAPDAVIATSRVVSLLLMSTSLPTWAAGPPLDLDARTLRP